MTRVADDGAVLPPVRKLGEIKHAADISDEKLLAALGYGPDATPVTAEALALVAEIKSSRFTAADMDVLVRMAWWSLLHRPRTAEQLAAEMCSGFHRAEVACTPLSDRWRRRLPDALAWLQAEGKATDEPTEKSPAGVWQGVFLDGLNAGARTLAAGIAGWEDHRCPLTDPLTQPQEKS